MIRKIFLVLFSLSVLFSSACGDVSNSAKEPIENIINEETVEETVEETETTNSSKTEYQEEVDVVELIEAFSDGELDSTTDDTYDYYTDVEDSSELTESEDSSETVYVTKTGSKYHSYGCQYLSKSCIEKDLSVAESQGYTPCSKCW